MPRSRTKKDVLKYLRIYRRQKDKLAAVALKKGEWFLGKASTDDYEQTRAWKKTHRPRVGHCFLNAQRFCMAHTDVRYMEGFLLISGMPTPHAWNVMKDGRVVDFTFEAADRQMIRERGYCESLAPLYLGVEVPKADLSVTGKSFFDP